MLGCLGDNSQAYPLITPNNVDSHRCTNILGPKHFIVEEENEALLAKEFEETNIQSTHSSHSSMHSSHPHLCNVDDNEFVGRQAHVGKQR
jgi:hypothetical protein